VKLTSGSTALITGASSGIGAATAALLAARGVRLRLTGRSATALADVAGPLGAATRTADLSDVDSLAELAGWAADADLVVCNAGIGWAGPVAEMPAAKLTEVIDVNLTSAIRLTRLLLPGLLARGHGHLVYVTSIAGSMGVADEAVYSAAKAGLHTFATALRQELHHTGVGVSVVAPGVVDTDFFARRGTPYTRRSPKPIPATTVAAAILDAVEHNRREVFTPAWLRLPARLNGALPTLTATLQAKFT
jgi:short-subunit dehydrogenase